VANGVAVALVSGAMGAGMTKLGAETKYGSETMSERKEFYCNTKALSATERARHNELTKKLLEVRKAMVESEKGYELQYSPADVTVAEIAEWVVMESKCCPFFDFHIDLEDAGTLICLRLTGTDGVKQFIRAEFGLR
jgi:hypothetical protein